MSLTLQSIADATADARILVDRCTCCGCEQTMPAPTCFACGNNGLVTVDHGGQGEIFSWVVAHYAFEPELAAVVPYTLVMVSLHGGARVYGRLGEPAPPEDDLRDFAVELDAERTRERGHLTFRPRRTDEAGFGSGTP